MQFADEHPKHGRLRPYLIMGSLSFIHLSDKFALMEALCRQSDASGLRRTATNQPKWLWSGNKTLRRFRATRHEQLVSKLELIQCGEQDDRSEPIDQGRKKSMAPDPRFTSAYQLQADGHVNKAVDQHKGKCHQEA